MGERGFVTYPHLVDWIEFDRKSWLGRLARELQDGYEPRPCQSCFQPKVGAMVRPGSVLQPDDEIVYAFLVGRLQKYIWALRSPGPRATRTLPISSPIGRQWRGSNPA